MEREIERNMHTYIHTWSLEAAGGHIKAGAEFPATYLTREQKRLPGYEAAKVRLTFILVTNENSHFLYILLICLKFRSLIKNMENYENFLQLVQWRFLPAC